MEITIIWTTFILWCYLISLDIKYFLIYLLAVIILLGIKIITHVNSLYNDIMNDLIFKNYDNSIISKAIIKKLKFTDEEKEEMIKNWKWDTGNWDNERHERLETFYRKI